MANFALYIINRLACIIELESLYCAVRTESLYNTDMFRLSTVKLVRYSPVGTVTSYRSDDGVLWMDFRLGQEIVFFSKASRTAVGHMQPSLQYVQALFTSILYRD
jgi:hypothetical protein